MKDVPKKVECLDYLLLKQLIMQVNYDLNEFLQVNLFNLNAFGDGGTHLNGRLLSKTEERHFYASSFARSILDNPPADFCLTARQYAAAELLYQWGRILRPEELQPNHKNMLRASIKNYISHLGANEAKLFSSLLDDEQIKENSKLEPKKQENQENEILRIIRGELKLDPLKLPPRPPGGAWVKSQVKSKLSIPGKLFTDNSFERAWERLRKSEKIKEEN